MDYQVKFGPSGNSDSFYEQGYKSSLDMPKWLHDLGLKAYEYSCTRGVNLKEKTARDIGEQAAKWGISMSLHAPYYINLASQDPEGPQKSIKYLYQTMEAAEWFGADRVVFHPGAVGKLSREAALEAATEVLKDALDACSTFIAKGIHMCPETMGKRNQLGNLDEVLTLCKIDKSLVPTVDFGHIHALNQGVIKTKDDYKAILDRIAEVLGPDRGSSFHVHFSRIEYTAAGEKKHWTYNDTQFGPDFDPLAELLAEKSLSLTIISESQGTMAEDALKLQEIYKKKFLLFK